MWEIRKWTCSGSDSVRTMPQIIDVIDTLAPIINYPDTVKVASTNNACISTVFMPGLTAVDNCSDDVQVTLSSSEDFAIFSDGELLELSVDTHLVVIQAIDACHNVSNDSVVIIIEDETPPIAVCLSAPVVALNGNETVQVGPDHFDSGSFDGCSDVTLQVARMNATCSADDLVFGDFISFCCDDVNNDAMVILQATDANGNTSQCMVNVTVQDGQNSCPTFNNTQTSFIIDGNTISSRGEEIFNVEMSLQDMSDVIKNSDKTNNSGYYAFSNNITGEDYKLAPKKNDDWINGVTTLDLTIIQNHILGKKIFSNPYDIIAADINKDGSISALDLVFLRKLILGITVSINSNTSWRFIWADQKLGSQFSLDEELTEEYEILSLENDMHIDWVGVKIGDLSGNAVANEIQKSESRSSQENVLSYEIGEIQGQTIVSFYLSDIESIDGLQGEIELPSQWKVTGIKGEQFGIRSDFIHIRSNKVAYSINHINPIVINPDLALFSIYVSGPRSENDILKLMDGRISPEVYSLGGAMSYRLEDRNDDVLDELRLYQNSPNPWIESTTITFTLPEAGPATIKAYNTRGDLLWNKEGEFEKGENSVVIHKKDIPITGSLIYEVTFQDQTKSLKMIRVD